MAKDSMTPILLLGGAGLAYWGYTKGWFSSLLGSSSSAGAAPTASTTIAAGGAASGATNPPSPSTPPSYSGPSLDQTFESLQAAVQAAYGSDPAFSCAGLSGLGLTPGRGTTGASAAPVAGRAGYQVNPITGGIATRPIGGVPSQRTAAPTVAASCANPLATYDVFNWYLTNKAGVSQAPAPPDHTSILSLTDYWTWCAAQLKKMNPGLAGGFNAGLGGYAELGMILERQAGGF